MSKAYADYERCKGCGLCIAYCKKDVIVMTDYLNSRGYKHIEIDGEKCIGCGICYTVCPDGVFTVTEKEVN